MLNKASVGIVSKSAGLTIAPASFAVWMVPFSASAPDGCSELSHCYYIFLGFLAGSNGSNDNWPIDRFALLPP